MTRRTRSACAAWPPRSSTSAIGPSRRSRSRLRPRGSRNTRSPAAARWLRRPRAASPRRSAALSRSTREPAFPPGGEHGSARLRDLYVAHCSCMIAIRALRRSIRRREERGMSPARGFLTAVGLLAAAAVGAPALAQQVPIKLQVAGNLLATGLILKNKEQPFFENLAKTTGLPIDVDYKPMDTTGIKDIEGLRVLRNGLCRHPAHRPGVARRAVLPRPRPRRPEPRLRYGPQGRRCLPGGL